MYIDTPELADELIKLRALGEADAGPYARAFATDPTLGVDIGAEVDPDEVEARRRVHRDATDREGNTSFVELAIADVASDEFLGVIVMFDLDWRHRRCEVGFWLAQGARRHGIARRALRLALDWLFQSLRMRRVELTTLPESERVIALAESLGFVREGLLRSRNLERGSEVDVAFFGLLRQDWRVT